MAFFDRFGPASAISNRLIQLEMIASENRIFESRAEIRRLRVFAVLPVYCVQLHQAVESHPGNIQALRRL